MSKMDELSPSWAPPPPPGRNIERVYLGSEPPASPETAEVIRLKAAAVAATAILESEMERYGLSDAMFRGLKLLRGAISPANRPEIVCICGSSRFIEHMAILAWEFEKQGLIALGLHLVPMEYAKCADHLAEHQGCAAAMDELHLRKIEMADRVFVVNVGGYIGDSTRREIAHARQLGKPVKWLEEEPVGAHRREQEGSV